MAPTPTAATPSGTTTPTPKVAANQATPGRPAIQAATGKAPLLIYSATLQMAVFESKTVIDKIETMATDRGGYLVTRMDHAITIRVPAPVFAKTLDDIAALGDVLHQNVRAQDISAEFRDLEMQLKNLEAVRARLEQLLARAKTVHEALAVERELSRVAGQIETIKGRLKLYSELIAFSTIQVNLSAQPVEHVDAVVELPFPWLRRLGLTPLLEL